jgi:hypothetical protein
MFWLFGMVSLAEKTPGQEWVVSPSIAEHGRVWAAVRPRRVILSQKEAV